MKALKPASIEINLDLSFSLLKMERLSSSRMTASFEPLWIAG
jgi:hypothetical protein